MKAVLISLSLVALAGVVSYRLRLRQERDLLIATARALAQLFVVAATITAVFESLGRSGLFLVIMFGAAAWTSGRRLRGVPQAALLAGASIGASSAVAILVLFSAGAFPFEPQFLIPIAGMLIGNTMTATSLAGGRLRDEIRSRRAEIETRLVLGDPIKTALTPYRSLSATTALIPMIDSTKNLGVIALPGAFVGMVLSGASPVEAAQVQLVVMFMLLGAVALAGMVTTALVARSFVAPGDRLVPPAPDLRGGP